LLIAGKPDDPRFAQKATAIQRSTAVQTNRISLTTKSTNFREWGAPSPENFSDGFIPKAIDFWYHL
jgi:hypothetical protein